MAREDGIFIGVEVDEKAAGDAELAAKLAEVCPVDIYEVEGGESGVAIVKENVDECVLCDLCVDAAPKGKVTIHRLYEE